MRNSIATRLITVLSLSATVILSGGMLLDYRVSRAEILQRLAAQAEVETRVVISDMENWLNGVEANTRLLARILAQRHYSRVELQQILREVVANNEEIFGAAIAVRPEMEETKGRFAPYYYVKEGQVMYADLAQRKNHYLEQPWFTEPLTLGKALWSEPYFDAGGGEVNMTTFSVPVYRSDADGTRQAWAVVTADVTLDALNTVLQQLHLGESSYGLLFSREGRVMSSHSERSATQHYSALHYKGLDRDSWQTMFQRALRGETTTLEFPCPQPGERCTLRLGRLSTTGWPVGVGYRQAEVIAPLYRYQLKTAAISGATLLLLALAVYLLTSRLTRPLVQLTRATETMARGDLDTPLPRATGKDEIARLLSAFARMNRALQTHIADLETATATRSRMEGELAAAREIQLSLLPGGGEALLPTDSAELWARVEPARMVGGDLYTYWQDQQHLFFAVGDVSDKGVPAALFMARAIGLIQQVCTATTPPGVAMADLNNVLEQDNQSCMFVTLFLAVLDLRNGHLHFASGGHTAPSLLRNGQVTILSQHTGPALGLAQNQHYPDNPLQLLPGDRLAIFTDGIDEAFNESAEMFGIERFNLALQASGGQTIARAGASLFQYVAKHAGTQPQSDDITLMLLDYRPHKAPRVQRSFHLGDRLTSRVQAWMTPILTDWAMPAQINTELCLAAEEIVTNIQQYGGLPDSGQISLTLVRAAQRVILEVRDPGRAFDPLHDAHRASLGADIDSAEIGGLGVHLLTQLTDRQSYRRQGEYNILRVEKRLPRAR